MVDQLYNNTHSYILILDEASGGLHAPGAGWQPLDRKVSRLGLDKTEKENFLSPVNKSKPQFSAVQHVSHYTD
jgi:hypothetical protein